MQHLSTASLLFIALSGVMSIAADWLTGMD
jgi:hypothetical protein